MFKVVVHILSLMSFWLPRSVKWRSESQGITGHTGTNWYWRVLPRPVTWASSRGCFHDLVLVSALSTQLVGLIDCTQLVDFYNLRRSVASRFGDLDLSLSRHNHRYCRERPRFSNLPQVSLLVFEIWKFISSYITVNNDLFPECFDLFLFCFCFTAVFS